MTNEEKAAAMLAARSTPATRSHAARAIHYMEFIHTLEDMASDTKVGDMDYIGLLESVIALCEAKLKTQRQVG